MVLSNDYDLLNPPKKLEKRKHKLKRLVLSPNSFFMDVKYQGCFNITTVCANCGGVRQLSESFVPAHGRACWTHR